MKYRLFFGLTTAALLAGCATPPGQLNESDFVSESTTVAAPIAVTYRNFLQGLRYCGPHTGAIFGTHHGVAECSPPEPNGSITCDMFVQSEYGGRSDFVLGRINFAPLETGTRTIFRVKNSVLAGKSQIINAWRKFTLGKAKGGVC